MLDYAGHRAGAPSWGDQSERIAALQKKVDGGEALIEREKIIRDRWADMHARQPARRQFRRR